VTASALQNVLLSRLRSPSALRRGLAAGAAWGASLTVSLTALAAWQCGGVICIDDGPVLHVWLGGMAYDGIDFSPYSVCFAEAYKYALAQGKQRVEAGRLNAKIKHRLGLTPQPLHAIVSPDLLAGVQRVRAPRVRAIAG